MEAMALIPMEQPSRFDADSVPRCARRGPARRCHTRHGPVARDTARARYTEGRIGNRHVPAYVDEPGVDPAQDTETYASLTVNGKPPVDRCPLHLAIRQGPRVHSAEIAVHFRPLPRYLLDQWPAAEPNVLRIGLTAPTSGSRRRSTARSAPPRPESSRRRHIRASIQAYANLILAMLRNDPMLFIRGDEAEESWRSSTPSWRHGREVRCRCRSTSRDRLPPGV